MTDDEKTPEQPQVTSEPTSIAEYLNRTGQEQQVYAEVPYIVTEAEIAGLAEALALGNASADKGEVTREDLTALVLWATGGKLAYMLLGEVLAGNLNVTIENGEPIFGRNLVIVGEEGEDDEHTT